MVSQREIQKFTIVAQELYLVSLQQYRLLNILEVRSRVGLQVTLGDGISCQRFHWLGCITRMGDKLSTETNKCLGGCPSAGHCMMG